MMSHICPSWLSFMLYNPVRKAFTDREKILDESGITADCVVLEVGAGNGFLTEVIAERAKKVVCVELQDGMVKKLKRRTERFGSKVEIATADIASHSIGETFADVCLMYYSFHEVKNKADAVVNISRALKGDGILSFYEPTVEVNKTEMQKTMTMFERIGFKRELSRDGAFTRFARFRKEK
ncbi:MAG: class I SAM-dependent methyltransferase [Thermodesulfovibrionia bacterium]|nr:class I SAM-dependent methyltransferase [Thermodesulfovibrionia bacterium]MCK5427518.1 class I SAM-dependent methyltransferase [Thermodesulfovibrionia bacterium]